MQRRSWAMGNLVLVAAAFGCSGGSAPSELEPETPPMRVPVRLEATLLKGPAQLSPMDSMTVGDTITVRIHALAADNADVAGVGLTWTAQTGRLLSAETTTSSTGATAVWEVGSKAGPQTVAVRTSGSLTVTLSRVALPGDITTVRINPAAVQIFKAGTRTLLATATDRFGNEVAAAAPQWTSLAPGLVTIGPSGAMMARAAGVARVTATMDAVADTADIEVFEPIPAPARVLALSGESTCRLASGGAVWCWGSNSGGALGDGSRTARSTPAQVGGNLGFTEIASGSSGGYVCGLAAASGYCWGSGLVGQLGMIDPPDQCGTTDDGRVIPCALQPAPVAAGGALSSISASSGHACALTVKGEALCWGLGANGELASGSTANLPVPTVVRGVFTFAAIAAGNGSSCGIDLSGRLLCWGRNGDGDLGVTVVAQTCGTLGPCSFDPVPVETDLAFYMIDTDGNHACAVAADHRGFCWGRNDFGQLGAGAGNGPVRPIAGDLRFQMIATGINHTCGLTLDGTAYCWGSNDFGELGRGSTGGFSTTPLPVAGSTRFTAIDAGWRHTCAVAMDDTTWCWGDNNNGQLGDGLYVPRSTPAPVAGGNLP